jgi:hypothetical protein
VGDWQWHAAADSVLLNHDASGADDLSAILSFGVLSHSKLGQTGKSVPKDRPVCVHYLVSSTKLPGMVASVAWDGRPAIEVRDKDNYVISGGMKDAPTLYQVFIQEVDPSRLIREAHGSIVYEMITPDGKRVSRRLDARSLGPNLAAGYQAITRLASDAAAGRCSARDCFITTATCDCLGLADDCFELTAARALRDGYLSRRADGPALIAGYYRAAPAIAAQLSGSRRGHRRLVGIYWSTILPCAVLVRIGAPGVAAALYEAMFRRLTATLA